jgi:hypothetical protein
MQDTSTGPRSKRSSCLMVGAIGFGLLVLSASISDMVRRDDGASNDRTQQFEALADPIVTDVSLGQNPPASLRRYHEGAAVWVFDDDAPRTFLGVRLTEPSFTVDRGLVDAALLPARGYTAYESWERELERRLGQPPIRLGRDPQILKWRGGPDGTIISLSYNPTTDQSLIVISRTE